MKIATIVLAVMTCACVQTGPLRERSLKASQAVMADCEAFLAFKVYAENVNGVKLGSKAASMENQIGFAAENAAARILEVQRLNLEVDVAQANTAKLGEIADWAIKAVQTKYSTDDWGLGSPIVGHAWRDGIWRPTSTDKFSPCIFPVTMGGAEFRVPLGINELGTPNQVKLYLEFFMVVQENK